MRAGTCFDPCSHGSSSRTSTRPSSRHRRGSGFDPCSHGSSSRTRRGETRREGHLRFRSLFSWIILADRAGLLRCAAHRGVSILVLMDHPRGRAFDTARSPLYFEFRSLFSWIILADRRSTSSHKGRSSGFDPCSHGSSSRTTVNPVPTATPFMFRSLFSWIILADSTTTVLLESRPDVSILVLMDHPRGPGEIA